VGLQFRVSRFSVRVSASYFFVTLAARRPAFNP